MIKNLNKKKNDRKIIAWIVVGFLFVVWLCTPPAQKFVQICFWGNHTKFFFAKMTNKAATTEWLFHRNNAIYLAKMNYKEDSLREMDKAIMTYPSYMPEYQLKGLYKDRALLKIFYKDYKGALNDYLKLDSPDLADRLRIALLYKENGKNKYALAYCNSIINIDSKAYAGYACMADIYAGVGRPDVSVKVFDLLIDRATPRGQYYADRAAYKKLCGDTAGYDADMQKAKEFNYVPNLDNSIIKNAIAPKVLNLSIY